MLFSFFWELLENLQRKDRNKKRSWREKKNLKKPTGCIEKSPPLVKDLKQADGLFAVVEMEMLVKVVMTESRRAKSDRRGPSANELFAFEFFSPVLHSTPLQVVSSCVHSFGFWLKVFCFLFFGISTVLEWILFLLNFLNQFFFSCSYPNLLVQTLVADGL